MSSCSRSEGVALSNTFGLPCVAREVWRAVDVAGVQQTLDSLRARHERPLLLGGGSNFLFVEPDLAQPVLQPAIRGVRYQPQAAGSVLVHAGAGEVWHELVLATLAEGWSGLENLALIPGTVGAAPVQNIGAYGVELCEFIEYVDAVEIETGSVQRYSRDACRFGYRDSLFKSQRAGADVIVGVGLRLQRQGLLRTDYETLARELASCPADQLNAMAVAEAVMRVRRARLPDPAQIGNAGSFFKNPVVDAQRAAQLLTAHPEMPVYRQDDGSVKLAAGWLIDRAGLRGVRRGQAGTHERQALVLVNHGGASGAELLALAREIRDVVRERFAVTLEPEVRIVGARF